MKLRYCLLGALPRDFRWGGAFCAGDLPGPTASDVPTDATDGTFFCRAPFAC
eukprot:COSAG02_NODE_2075_length_9928_cov_9.770272_6_plen_52_part_00